MMIYVLTWNYLDKSAFGIIGAFDDEVHAGRLADLLNEYSDRQFSVIKVPKLNFVSFPVVSL